MNLKLKAIKGVKWTSISSAFNAILQLIQLAVLAWLLDPAAFGLMAIVMVVIGFSQLFIDLGVSNAIIYKNDISDNKLSSLYWLNIIIGILFFVLVFLTAPLISIFYQNKVLTPLISVVSITFLIKPWGQQFMILLQKDLIFNVIGKIEIIGRSLAFISTIILAFLDFGVYSIAIGTVVYSIVTTLGFLSYGLKFYQPKLYFNYTEIKDFLSFGLFQMGEKIIIYFNSQFDTILIGKLLGIEILGIYNVAKGLVSKPAAIINPVITKVTFPLLSKSNNNIPRIRSIYLKTIKYLSYINFPLYILLAFLAKPLVTQIFGEDWLQSVFIIQVLCMVYLIRSTGNPAGSLLLSRGRADIAFYWNVISLLVTPIFIYTGSFFGLNGILYSLLSIQVIMFFPNWKYIVNKMAEITLIEYINALFKPLIISFGLILIFIIPAIYITNDLLTILLVVLFYSIFYGILVWRFEEGLILDIQPILPFKKLWVGTTRKRFKSSN